MLRVTTGESTRITKQVLPSFGMDCWHYDNLQSTRMVRYELIVINFLNDHNNTNSNAEKADETAHGTTCS